MPLGAFIPLTAQFWNEWQHSPERLIGVAGLVEPRSHSGSGYQRSPGLVYQVSGGAKRLLSKASFWSIVQLSSENGRSGRRDPLDRIPGTGRLFSIIPWRRP